MSQNQEIIEAKLCAYIDDELDAAGRAELEKHLAANPQHQRLIEELRRTSALIRNLPHESAPPELAEGFNAQLERSVLLEGVSEDVAAADLKAPRWPQLVAMAAITLLTIGLGVVVYFALPGAGARPEVVQMMPHPSAMPAPGSEDDQSTDAKMRDVDKATNQDQQKLSLKKDENGPLASVNQAPGVGGGAVANAARSLSVDHLAPSGAATQPTDESSVSHQRTGESSPIVLVMHSDDPAEARRSLVIYLVQQNIAWEPAQAPAMTDGVARRDGGEIQKVVGGASPLPQRASSGQPATQPTLDAKAESAKAAPTIEPSAPIAAAAAPLSVATSAIPASPATQPVGDVAKRLQSTEGEPAPRIPEATVSKLDFSISCKMSVEQANALRASLAQPGTFIDPLPADFEQKAVAEVTAKQPAEAQPSNAPDFSLQTSAPAALPPTTNPVADAAPASPPPAVFGPADQSAKFGASATQPAEAPSDKLAAASATTEPANSPAAMLDLVIVVRPSDSPATQPATVAPQAPTTAPAQPISPATQP
jgi:hypothetical protein